MAIGNYFNELLLYSVFIKKTLSLHCTLKEEWYYQKFHALIPSSLVSSGDYSDVFFPLDFYHKYKVLLDEVGYKDNEIEETLVPVPQDIPTGFYEELQFQKNIRNMLYFLLDISVQNMGNLSVSQRIWIYSNIFKSQKDLSDMCVNRKLLFCLPMLRTENDQQTESSYIYNNDVEEKINNIFFPFNTHKSLDVANNGISKDMMDTVIEYAQTINVTQIYEEYEISNLQELLTLEILSMIRAGTVIKKCENCGKYFVPKNKKKKYCDRTDEFGATCYKIAKKKKFQQNLENDPAFKLYNTAYKTHFAQKTAGTVSQNEFNKWQYDAKTKLNLVRAGKWDISSFREWLKKPIY